MFKISARLDPEYIKIKADGKLYLTSWLDRSWSLYNIEMHR